MRKQRGIAMTWLVIAIAVLLVGGAAALYFTGAFDTTDNENAQNQNQQQTQQQQPDSDQSLLESALAGNASIECIYTHKDGSNGVAYLREDGTFRVEQTTNEGEYRMIKQDNFAYIWRIDQTEGIKVDSSLWEEEYRDTFAVFSPDQFEEQAEGVNAIDCERRSNFDETLFQPPENVEFSDLSQFQQMQQQ